MNKYNAKKIQYNGMIFDSRKEKDRYIFLRNLERQGKIFGLVMQRPFLLIPEQREEDIKTRKGLKKGKVIERPVYYYADFVYEDETGLVVEDVKGYRKGTAYSLFVLKRKLMLFRYGIRIREV